MFDLPMSDPMFDTERRKSMNYTKGPLYALSSTGKVKMWQGEVNLMNDRNNLGGAYITLTHGYETGKKQSNNKEILVGKNIGKSNETTPWEQAILEVDSKAQKKIDEGYSEDKSTLSVPLLPMLAHPYEKRKHNIKWPAIIQPKIDGVRCTCTLKDSKLVMFTRKGKQFTAMPHLATELILYLTRLSQDRSNIYLDGELYSDTLTFQELAGAVRRENNDEEYLKQIHYRVFDCFDTDDVDWPFNERWNHIINDYGQYPKQYIRPVPTEIAENETFMYAKHDQYIQEGYEGIMIRNMYAKYTLRYRSPDLQKYKKFVDDEFKIINFKEGEGSEVGCVIWQCETSDNQSFWVRPSGTRETRQDLYNNGKDYIGSNLTVRYQELTDEGIPRFPVGITIRDYE